MSMWLRWALGMLLIVGLAGCGGSKPELVPEPFTYRESPPQVRVGIVRNADAAMVGAQESFTLSDASGIRAVGRPGEIYAVRIAGNALELFSPVGEALGRVGGELRVIPDRRDGNVLVNGDAYPQRLQVRRSPTGGLNVINVVDLETYLKGVVTSEIAHESEAMFQAASAQAVAARTYVAGHINQYAAEGFDMVPTVMDQVYRPDKRHPNADRAVDATRALILTYDGRPIRANYASTCGGKTAGVSESFDSDPLPYLVSHDDRLNGDVSCRESSVYSWEVTWSASELLAILAETVPAALGKKWRGASIRDIKITERGPSGRAVEVRIRTDQEEYVMRKLAIRRVFSRPEAKGWMRSTAVQFDLKRQGDQVVQVTASGKGWGHGVGMCQWGAMQLSKEEYDFRTILKHYYPGTVLTPWYAVDTPAE